MLVPPPPNLCCLSVTCRFVLHVCLHTLVLQESRTKCHPSLSSRPPQPGDEEELINPALTVAWRQLSVCPWPCISHARQLHPREGLCSEPQGIASSLRLGRSRHMLSALPLPLTSSCQSCPGSLELPGISFLSTSDQLPTLPVDTRPPTGGSPAAIGEAFEEPKHCPSPYVSAGLCP